MKLSLAHDHFIVKLNRDELAATLGIPLDSDEAIVQAARQIAPAGGARSSRWARKWLAIAFDGRHTWRVITPKVKAISAVGSGDAFAAGLAWSLMRGMSLPQALVAGSACGAANALTAFSGQMNHSDFEAAKPAGHDNPLISEPSFLRNILACRAYSSIDPPAMPIDYGERFRCGKTSLLPFLVYSWAPSVRHPIRSCAPKSRRRHSPPAAAQACDSWLLHLPGIAGKRWVDDQMMLGFKDAGVATSFDIYDWTGEDPGIAALHAYKRNQEQAQVVADLIADHFHRHPELHILLSGHSGGTGIAVWALEKLPADVKIDKLLLMASALVARLRPEQGPRTCPQQMLFILQRE